MITTDRITPQVDAYLDRTHASDAPAEGTEGTKVFEEQLTRHDIDNRHQTGENQLNSDETCLSGQTNDDPRVSLQNQFVTNNPAPTINLRLTGGGVMPRNDTTMAGQTNADPRVSLQNQFVTNNPTTTNDLHLTHGAVQTSDDPRTSLQNQFVTNNPTTTNDLHLTHGAVAKPDDNQTPGVFQETIDRARGNTQDQKEQQFLNYFSSSELPSSNGDHEVNNQNNLTNLIDTTEWAQNQTG